ncbi:MAG: hypothetical protein QM636_21695 [Rhizobium sp.]
MTLYLNCDRPSDGAFQRETSLTKKGVQRMPHTPGIQPRRIASLHRQAGDYRWHCDVIREL